MGYECGRHIAERENKKPNSSILKPLGAMKQLKSEFKAGVIVK